MHTTLSELQVAKCFGLTLNRSQLNLQLEHRKRQVNLSKREHEYMTLCRCKVLVAPKENKQKAKQ